MKSRSHRPFSIAIVLGCLLLLFAATSATAATRFAAPDGKGADPCANPAAPCSLYKAADRNAPGTTIAAGDEVVLAAGVYENPGFGSEETPLGPIGTVFLAAGTRVHGPLTGAPAIIRQANPEAFGVLTTRPGVVVSDIEVVTAGRIGIEMLNGTVERTVVRATRDGAIACSQMFGGIIRDSVCIANGRNSVAVGVEGFESRATPLARTARLRNVTAKAVGPGSFGIHYAWGGHPDNLGHPTYTVDARSVIAIGEKVDVHAFAGDGGVPGSGAHVRITLSHSAFNSRSVQATEPFIAESIAEVTAPGTNGNIMEEPSFDFTGFHQAQGSRTIEAGIADEFSGTHDIDGNLRSFGRAPDIGADERVAFTKTEVRCTPSTVETGDISICTATVIDQTASPTIPSGRVNFTEDGTTGHNNISNGGACTPSPVDVNRASCQVRYRATQVGSHFIVGAHEGDEHHESDNARSFGFLTVTQGPAGETRNPTSSALKCSPEFLVPGQVSTCTITVEDVSFDGAFPVSSPQGTVQFASDKEGTFSARSCTLAPLAGNAAKASCRVDYTPQQASSKAKITAQYPGDLTHRKNLGSFFLSVAATRFAAPGGEGADPCADPAKPCSLYLAAATNAPGTTIEEGAEVILAPGEYKSSAGDLGPNGSFDVKHLASVHGRFGEPRPVINLDRDMLSGLDVSGPLSHLEILSRSATMNFRATDTVIDDVISRASLGTACDLSVGGVIRDTACVTSGSGVRALVVGGLVHGLANSFQLRNVTAVATGNNSTGLVLAVSGILGVPTMKVNAKSVIARGGAVDVRVDSVTRGAAVEAEFDRSSYAITQTLTHPEGGIANVTEPGSGTNISALPRLAADGFHQLPDSPTIDAGATDQLSGPFDIDGELRTTGPAADIGADEFQPNPTTTALTCQPARVTTGSPSTCTATVTDTAAKKTSLAGDKVTFAVNPLGKGAFGQNPAQCTLTEAGPVGTATCQITYTPAEKVNNAIHTITANYGPAPAHKASSAGFGLSIRVVGGGGPILAEEAGTRYQCKLDNQPYKPCSPPFKAMKKKLKKGRHVLRVRSISPEGVVDPTPTVHRWTVGKAEK